MIDEHDPDHAAPALSMLRWATAGAVVAAAHAGVVWFALNWKPAAASFTEPPSAVMVELAPVAVASEAPPQEVAPGPQTVQSDATPTPDEPEKEEEEPAAEPEPVVEKVKEPVEESPPVPSPEPEIKVPKPPEAETAEAVLPPPPPPKPVTKPKPETKKVDRKKAARPKKQRSRQTTAPPKSRAQRADRTAAPFASTSQSHSQSPATWRGAMMAHLNRHKRFPPSAGGSGTAHVAFTIDRSGRVVSCRLIRSSGNSAYDSEAVSLPRRASPVPAPPPGVGGGTITLTVPVRFAR